MHENSEDNRFIKLGDNLSKFVFANPLLMLHPFLDSPPASEEGESADAQAAVRARTWREKGGAGLAGGHAGRSSLRSSPGTYRCGNTVIIVACKSYDQLRNAVGSQNCHHLTAACSIRNLCSQWKFMTSLSPSFSCVYFSTKTMHKQ